MGKGETNKGGGKKTLIGIIIVSALLNKDGDLDEMFFIRTTKLKYHSKSINSTTVFK